MQETHHRNSPHTNRLCSIPVTDIAWRKSAGEIQQVGLAKGFKLMRDDGWTKVLKGITTVEEIMRVTKVSAAALSD